jgi:hypothetical protein
LVAWWRDMLRPAPWQAELHASASPVVAPASTYDAVPIDPPISTGCP